MARNLVKEKEEEKQEAPVVPVAPQEKEEVKVITWEALIANNLDSLHAKIDALARMTSEGFKQVGVKFEDAK
ncbi:MAG: hypothetical protein FJZ63_02145 [Chlamydiae bacterium]|nr:hypothetical protein [Chlamydiota bacterium]